MPRIRVRTNRRGILDVLNSPGVRKDIETRVDAVTRAAQGMHDAKGYTGDVIATDRPHGAVRATDMQARRSNARHNTLLKALDAGRDGT